MRAWGANFQGQLGIDNVDPQTSRVTVQNLDGVKRVAAGCNFALALKRNGTVRSWGDNANGQLGNDNQPNDSLLPSVVEGLDNVVALAGGDHHSLALKRNGTVMAWGSNNHGELGDDNAPNGTDVPQTVPGLNNVKAIAAGTDVSLALKENGTVRAWGYNSDGQLGNGDEPNDQGHPVKVRKLEDVVAIASGCEGYTMAALRSNGTVWTWGYNSSGELGNGTEGPSSDVPVKVVNMNDVKAIAGGYQQMMALKENGTVWAWGENGDGQLGDGTLVSKPVPVRVEKLKGVKAIAMGDYTGYALKNDGTIRAWGDNSDGELGNDDAPDDRTYPVKVLNVSNVVHISAGTETAYAVRE